MPDGFEQIIIDVQILPKRCQALGIAIKCYKEQDPLNPLFEAVEMDNNGYIKVELEYEFDPQVRADCVAVFCDMLVVLVTSGRVEVYRSAGDYKYDYSGNSRARFVSSDIRDEIIGSWGKEDYLIDRELIRSEIKHLLTSSKILDLNSIRIAGNL